MAIIRNRMGYSRHVFLKIVILIHQLNFQKTLMIEPVFTKLLRNCIISKIASKMDVANYANYSRKLF